MHLHYSKNIQLFKRYNTYTTIAQINKSLHSRSFTLSNQSFFDCVPFSTDRYFYWHPASVNFLILPLCVKVSISFAFLNWIIFLLKRFPNGFGAKSINRSKVCIITTTMEFPTRISGFRELVTIRFLLARWSKSFRNNDTIVLLNRSQQPTKFKCNQWSSSPSSDVWWIAMHTISCKIRGVMLCYM